LQTNQISVSNSDRDGIPFPWFAVTTRSGFERVASTSLAHKGMTSYLPTYRTKRRWSDRVVVADIPLFRGYVFCRFDPSNRLPVLTTPGVVSIVGFGPGPSPIDENEINNVQAVLHSGLATEPCPFLREGQKVRVKRGSLEGVDGILVTKKSDFRLIISVQMLQRSVSVEIDREWIEAV